ncbi:hypothetical protein Tco_0990634 [Tanacetum coccineum]|uniref:Xylulose kinase-1 n=1 Tax=Tanacetum coccineum TaxID=301880 RepID=A0ABQ5EXB6_9ASTR
MSDLKFADTYNLVVFLSKPAESEGFEQIVDFLNANPIKYDLIVNPTVYCSCIKQFWDTVKAKTVNGEVQLQALVDKKKVIITESTIRRDLQLEDVEGTDCLPNATIFEQLTLTGYEKLSQKLTFYKAFFSPQRKYLIHTILQCLSTKTTAWNEFSSTMASAIICLATNQKFNFSKYIFDNMVKNVDSMVKFWMYPRFVQVFMNKQVGDMSHHKRIYVTPSHTKKIFENMKREGKGFSGRVTPLFPTMMVQAQEEMGEGLANPTDPHHTPIITQPSTSQPQKKQKPRKSKRKDTEIRQSSGPIEPIADEAANEENVPTHSNDPLLSGEDSLKLNDLMEICTTLQKKVLDLETSKTTQAHEISSLKLRVKRLKKKGGSRTHKLKRLFKVGRSAQVVSSEDEGLGDQEDASKLGRKIDDIDKDAEVTLAQGRYGDDLVFDISVLDGEEVFVEQDVVEKEVSTVDPPTTTDEVVTTASVEVSVVTTTIITATTTVDDEVEMTLAQTLIELKSARPKAKGLVVHDQEPSKSITTTTTTAGILLQDPSETRTTIPSKDKGKGIIVEEPLKMKKKDQDKVETNYELAQSLLAEEQKELTIEEKSKLFVQLLEKRRKFFAAKRAEEKRNKPPTKAQQRSIMTTYLKNMAGWKSKDLKTNETREEESSKRAGDELEQKKSKKQKLDEKVEAEADDAKEAEELKKCLEIVPDDGDDVTIDVTHLVLLVQKLLLLVLKVNAAGIKVTTAERLQLLKG